MRTITDRFYDALERQLAEITLNGENPTEQYKASVLVCKKAMNKLKSYTSTYAFENQLDEIRFFKEVKPRFYSKYIYYVNLYNFSVQQPIGSEDIQRAYIQMHLAELKTFFDHNRAFYAYYRSGMDQMDELYFTRGGFDVHAELEDFEEDEKFSTSHDYKLAKLMANEKFQDHLNLEMLRIGNEGITLAEGQSIFPFKHPQWTASQTDLVELLYSLKTGCAVNHGNIDIAELAAIFAFVFQVELNETYHKLLDITRRKKEMFVFLTRLRISLESFIREKFAVLMLVCWHWWK